MREQELAEALQACQEYAELGYDFANDRYQEIHKTMKKVRKQLKETNRRQSKINRIANSRVIAREQENVEELQRMDWEIQDDLNELLEQQKEFSVVVFGRTMAGKSTLMEILTHGNGESIGKGAQRTTRDVRDYRWKGMKVTDVPGICSFDGREDDELAMRAAKSADLILFLITDDAPQDSEAEKLAELKRLGKNVLGVINVKLGLNMSRRKMALRDLEKKMDDDARIETICDQFRAFGPRYHQDWSKLPFVATHLQAAYLGQDDPELYELSNFDAVEEYILDKVQRDACFLRMKTFIDRVSVPLSDHIAMLLDDTANTADEAFGYRLKWNDLEEWQQGFQEETQEKFNRFMQRLRNQMDDTINDFVEDNYSNKNAGEDWNATVADMHIEEKCRSFLKERAETCNRKRRELADEFATEIHFRGIKTDVGSIDPEDTTTYGGLFGGAAFLGAMTGVGLPIVLGLSILSAFSDSKEKKIREAKEKMRKVIHDRMDPELDKVGNQVYAMLENEIFDKGMNEFGRSLMDMDVMLFQLAADQENLAYDFKRELQLANAVLWKYAVDSIVPSMQQGEVGDYIQNLRIPGRAFVLFSEQQLPERSMALLKELIDEPVQIIEANPDDGDAMWEAEKDLADQLLEEAEWEILAFDYGSEDDMKVYYTSIPDGEIEEDSVAYRLVQQMFYQPILPC